MKNAYCKLSREEIHALPDRFKGFLLSPFQFNRRADGMVLVPEDTFQEMIDIIAEYAAQAQAGDGARLKAAILAALNSHEREMEGYSYFGSNPGVAHDDYDEVADEVVAAMAAPATSNGESA